MFSTKIIFFIIISILGVFVNIKYQAFKKKYK